MTDAAVPDAFQLGTQVIECVEPPRPRRRLQVLIALGVTAVIALTVAWIHLGARKDGDAEIASLPRGARTFSIAAKLDCGVTDDGLGALVLSHPDLEVLALTQCPQVTNRGLQSIGEFKSLRILIAQGIHGFDETGLTHLLRCDKLEELGLAGVDISAQGMELIVQLPALKELSLSRDRVEEATLNVLRRKRPDVRVQLL